MDSKVIYVKAIRFEGIEWAHKFRHLFQPKHNVEERTALHLLQIDEVSE